MPGTLAEILQSKKVGETWLSYIAPEEFHVWHKPWDAKKFRAYGVQILSVGISANETVKGTKNEQIF